MLNHDTGVPLYRQLADLLAERIHSGKLQSGEQIPSEPELARNYSIGRPTVRQATELLVRRGLLERRRGAGTFVSGSIDQVDLFTLGGTNAAFEGAGLELQTRIVAPVSLVASLGPEVGSLASRSGFVLTRLGCIDNQPVLLEHMALAEDVFPAFERLPLEGESLSRLIERQYQRRPRGGHQTLQVTILAPPEARLLEVNAGQPALFIQRRLDFAGAAGAIFVRLFVLTHRVALSQTLNVPERPANSAMVLERSP